MLSVKVQPPRRERFPLTKPIRETKSSTQPAICPKCQAVRRNGAWTLDPTVRREVQRWRAPGQLLCPACRVIRDGTPSGILYLQGSFVAVRRAEIMQLVRNVERASAAKNPLERIITVRNAPPDEVVIDTTSEKLVRRLGRALSRAYHGRLQIRFSHGETLVRVYWRRDASEPAP